MVHLLEMVGGTGISGKLHYFSMIKLLKILSTVRLSEFIKDRIVTEELHFFYISTGI